MYINKYKAYSYGSYINHQILKRNVILTLAVNTSWPRLEIKNWLRPARNTVDHIKILITTKHFLSQCSLGHHYQKF